MKRYQVWEYGWGNGVTGPTSPTCKPTVTESVEYTQWENNGANEAARPPIRHNVVRQGLTTLAIIPLPKGNERVGHARGTLMARAPAMHVLLKAVYEVVKDKDMPELKDWKRDAGIVLTVLEMMGDYDV